MGKVVDFYKTTAEDIQIIEASADDIRRVVDAYLQAPTTARINHLEHLAIIRAAAHPEDPSAWYAMAAAETLLGFQPYRSIGIMLHHRDDDAYIPAALALLFKNDDRGEDGIACMERVVTELITYLPDHESTPLFLNLANRHYLKNEHLEERLEQAKKDIEFNRQRRRFRKP
jgi:hypothetical protein